MKITNAVLALCIISEASSFMVQTPAASKQPVSTSQLKSFSYLGDFSDDEDTKTVEKVKTDFPVPDATRAPLKKADGPGNISRQAAPSPTVKKASSGNSNTSKGIWDNFMPTICQGGSLRTWSFTTPYVERVQVTMKTEGRPLNADIDLWQGPDNTPQKMSVFLEDGDTRPFCAVIETPGGENTIAIRNTGQVEFPLAAGVGAEVVDRQGNVDANSRLAAGISSLPDSTISKVIQGGAIKTYSFDSNVSSIQILLKTDGRPLNARLELLQGPNNNKQIVDLYTEDGMRRPFYAVIETPGNGNVVRIINTAPVEFPLSASVEPFMIDNTTQDAFIVSGGGGGGGWDNGSPF